MVMEPIMPGAFPKMSSRARIQTDKVSGKPVLLFPEGVLILNETGQAIVSLCTGEFTFAEIVRKLAEGYRVSEQTIGPEVTTYMNRLRDRNLLEIRSGTDTKL